MEDRAFRGNEKSMIRHAQRRWERELQMVRRVWGNHLFLVVRKAELSAGVGRSGQPSQLRSIAQSWSSMKSLVGWDWPHAASSS